MEMQRYHGHTVLLAGHAMSTTHQKHNRNYNKREANSSDSSDWNPKSYPLNPKSPKP